MDFTQYLQRKKRTASTANTYNKSIGCFLAWLRDEGLLAETFTYTDLLAFMQYCHLTGRTKRTVHRTLGIVRHYCNYLIHEGKRDDNPAAGVFIKGLARKLPTNLLSMEEMEELYSQYRLQLNVDASRKIMLGLMVYQGLTVAEIRGLHHHHFRVKDGKLLVRATKRTNERLLNLHAVQVSELQDYLSVNSHKEGALFVEPRKKEVSKHNIDNRIQYMFTQLRQINPKVVNAKQIRSSVIAEWLRKNNLRQVQYMAGHRYVSSTQRYQTGNLDDLQSELKVHHPMAAETPHKTAERDCGRSAGRDLEL